MRILFVINLWLLSAAAQAATIVTYPAPASAKLSTDYQVSVEDKTVDATDTSCSPDRPPYTTPTRSRFTRRSSKETLAASRPGRPEG